MKRVLIVVSGLTAFGAGHPEAAQSSDVQVTITIGEDRIESIEAGAESIHPDLRVEAAGGVEGVSTHAVEHVLRHVGSSSCHDCPGPELTGAADPS